MPDLVEITFGCCGIEAALPARRVEELKKTGDTFYCPNGHSRVYTVHPTDEEKLIERLRRQLNDAWDDRSDAYEQTRETKRILSTCPLCSKSVGRANMKVEKIRARLVEHLQNEHGARARMRALPRVASDAR